MSILDAFILGSLYTLWPYYVIGNANGLWHPSGKGDTSERLEQSTQIVAAMASACAEKRIMVGNLNTLSQAQSISLIEQARYRNLPREHTMTDTRTVFYDKATHLADHAFMSETVKVEAFRVDQSPVSDHAALMLRVA